jgi:hypothetical protein
MRRRVFLATVAAIPALGGRQTPFTPRTGRLKQTLFRSAFDPKMTFEAMCWRRSASARMASMRRATSGDHSAIRPVPTLAFPEVTPPPFQDGVARPKAATVGNADARRSTSARATVAR